MAGLNDSITLHSEDDFYETEESDHPEDDKNVAEDDDDYYFFSEDTEFWTDFWKNNNHTLLSDRNASLISYPDHPVSQFSNSAVGRHNGIFLNSLSALPAFIALILLFLYTAFCIRR